MSFSWRKKAERSAVPVLLLLRMRMDRNSLDGFVNDFVAVTVEGLLDGGGGAQSKKGRNEPLVDLCWGGGEKK